MRHRPALALAALALMTATAAHAAMGGGSKDEKPTPAPATLSEAPTPRQQAERLYGDAYAEVDRAKKDLAAGKTKNAEKRFTKAREWGQRAAALDTTYHEAWNLVGYASRKLGKYDDALAAYGVCLRLAPGYAPAREYLGEAYVEMGEPELAREQLAKLEQLGAKDEAATLRAAIEEHERSHPAKGGAGGH